MATRERGESFNVALTSPTSSEDDVARLNRYLRASEELQCACPAVLHCVSGSGRSRRVWLGVAKVNKETATRPEHMVVIFGRARVACMKGKCSRIPPALVSIMHGEFIYCVLPVAANVRLFIGSESCTFTWSHLEASDIPDCRLEEIRDNEGAVLETLQNCYDSACRLGIVFHEEQRQSEIWAYTDQLPLHLAKLPQSMATVPGGRRRTVSGVVWQDQELRVFCVTWNVGATLPMEDASLAPLLREEPGAHIIAVGLQETCELTALRLIQDGTEWTKWKNWVEEGVQEVYGDDLKTLEVVNLVGMLLVVFISCHIERGVRHVKKCGVGIGVGGVGGNKGAVGVRFDLGSTSVCFVNAHLAAGQEHYIERCLHFKMILQKMIFREEPVGVSAEAEADLEEDHAEGAALAARPRRANESLLSNATDMVGAGAMQQPSHLRRPLDKSIFVAPQSSTTDEVSLGGHDHIFWIGDTNSRLHWPSQTGGMPIEQARRKAEEHRIGELLALDQLNLMRRDGLAFHGFDEHKIRFLPSYKWRPHGDELDMRSQKHVPAWCDRILTKSMTRPAAKVHRYDIFLGLKQSDHRPVYASCSLTARGLVRDMAEDEGSVSSRCPADTKLGVDPWKNPALAVPITARSFITEPHEVHLRCVKPDRTQECHVWMTLHGQDTGAIVRFKVLAVHGDSDVAEPLGQFPGGYSQTELDGAVHGAQALPLAKWLSAQPSEGTLYEGHPEQLRVAVCLRRPVLRRERAAAALVVRLSNDVSSMDFRLQVAASLEPSVMRAPLPLLAGLTTLPLLSAKARAGDGFGPPVTPVQLCGEGGPLLPPKEAFVPMEWLLQRSFDATPGSLQWWPDPLRQGAQRSRDDMYEVMYYLEHARPLPLEEKLPADSATLFLLRWLSALPEPILDLGCAEAFLAAHLSRGTAVSCVRQLPPLHATVLLCLAALFAQMAERHGHRGDVVEHLTECLTQQVPPAESSKVLVAQLLQELANSSFPPMQALSGQG